MSFLELLSAYHHDSAHVSQLRFSVTFTKQERDAEVERAKHLVSKPAASHSIAGPGVGNANAETIALYEDITNILVTNARLETSPYLKLTDKMFTCLCSNKEGKGTICRYLFTRCER